MRYRFYRQFNTLAIFLWASLRWTTTRVILMDKTATVRFNLGFLKWLYRRITVVFSSPNPRSSKIKGNRS